MKNIEEIIKSIQEGNVKLELINDSNILDSSQTLINKDEYTIVTIIEDDKAFKAIYKKDDEYFYVERIYCADEAQTGSCNMEYEKLYKIL
ncbi:hypothetical protein RBU49_00460 [Clostridium sp. MB40-C1]|uniref:hypothetical protein n=1 Tax=Clostridium sp. MB40-C1 TaxID=3070996 RepID=UPI0027E0DCA3|nr:hypothetical protein [Clostridium sp. MB40-C1]WMJ80751.1 hypothetical protein RBU49_00460 [Clostridium sp. MB40-C1]